MTQAWLCGVTGERLTRTARRSAGLLLLLAFVVGVSGCNKLKSRDLLNKGVTAFKNGKTDDAIEDFKQAKALDPDLMNARLYLATAYMNLYIPGAPSEDNIKRGQQAIAEFQEVLQKDPNNLSAFDGIGSLLFGMAGQPKFDVDKFLESKRYHQKHIDVRPSDPEPYYWIAVIDWSIANHINAELRLNYNKDHINKQIRDTEPLPPAVRAQYVQKASNYVDEGIASLQKAIQIRPDYDDAMAYLNLLYRRKADLVESSSERESYLKQADDLLDKVKEIKQKRMEQADQQHN